MLGPDHGIIDQPKSQWRVDTKGVQDLLLNNTEMELAFKITDHVHYCTCDRAKHVEPILKKLKFRKCDKGRTVFVTAYESDMSGLMYLIKLIQDCYLLIFFLLNS